MLMSSTLTLINVDYTGKERHHGPMTNDPSLIQVPPGLKGVAVTDTAIGDVRGREGFYHYRQYSAVDLAEHCSFEDVWHLFVQGHLPDPAERLAFTGEV